MKCIIIPTFLMETERLSNLPQVVQMVRPGSNSELAPKIAFKWLFYNEAL